MLIRVVEDEIDDDPHPAVVCLFDELDEVAEIAEVGMDAVVIREVVAVVTPRRGVEGEKPEARDAQAREVVEPRRQTGDVADSVAVGVGVRADAQRIDEAVLVPALARHGAALMRGHRIEDSPTCGSSLSS